MTTPASPNAISLNDVNRELQLTLTASISMNDTRVRTLAGKTTNASTISMDDLRNKSDVTVVPITIDSTRIEYVLRPSNVPGYVTGKTDVRVIINGGVILYSNSVNTPALTVTGFSAGDKVSISNNGGYIVGRGGTGGNGGSTGSPGTAGGTAILVNGMPAGIFTIINYGVIGGGGGGGGGGGETTPPTPRHGGGGGAGYGTGVQGGANGGLASGGAGGTGQQGGPGGTGGGLGAVGGNGTGGTYLIFLTLAGITYGGAGGAGGLAVNGNSLITWSPFGDVRGGRIN